MGSPTDLVRCKVVLGAHPSTIGLRCFGEGGGLGTSGSFNGGVIHLSRAGVLSVNAAHAGLLVEQKKPGPKPKAKRSAKPKATPAKPEPTTPAEG